jgi:hypothetical protein
MDASFLICHLLSPRANAAVGARFYFISLALVLSNILLTFGAEQQKACKQAFCFRTYWAGSAKRQSRWGNGFA